MMQRNDAIDGLRGIFIILIVLGHTCSAFTWGTGTIGNIFFFMISGYFLYRVDTEGYSSCRNIELHTFLFKRLKTIYPSYFVTLMVSIALAGVSGLSNILMNVFLIQGGWFCDNNSYNGPTWFLSILVIDYIIFFLIVKFIKAEGQPYVFGVIAIITYSISIFDVQLPFLYSGTLIGITSFCIGCILRYITGFFTDSLKKVLRRLLPLYCIGHLIGCFIWGIWEFLGNALFMYIFFSIPALILCVEYNGIFAKFLSFPALSSMGRMSMYLFVWHAPLYRIYRSLNISSNIIGTDEHYITIVSGELLYLGILIVWCYVWQYLEKKINNIFKKYVQVQ